MPTAISKISLTNSASPGQLTTSRTASASLVSAFSIALLRSPSLHGSPKPPLDVPKRHFVVASRAFILAKVQTEATVELLQRTFPELSFSTSYMTFEGDRNQSQALYAMGGKSLWTKDLEVSLLKGDVDMLVHCVKNMPTTLPPGCVLAAITEREDPVDRFDRQKGLACQREGSEELV